MSLDDARTWPAGVKEAADRLADRYEGLTEHVTDLAQQIMFDNEEAGFNRTLQGTVVTVYHATRLLDNEMDRVRSEGLHPASIELAVSKIDSAYAAGVIDEAERDVLASNNLFVTGDEGVREGNVCFFASRGVLDNEVNAIWSLLTNWGGEIIYFNQRRDSRVADRLRTLGRPAIVVAAVDLSDSERVHLAAPGIAAAFIGKRLGLSKPDFDLHYRGTVDQILDIWTPGRPEYDRHTELPTT